MKQTDIEKLLTKYQAKTFNNSDIDDFIKSNENKIIVALRIPENQEAYANFDKEYSAYLDKLPESPLKRAVALLYNKKLVFFGTAKNTDGVVYTRSLISKNEKMAGVVLNAYALDISYKTGNTPAIDECVYASYFGLIRAAVLINREALKKDVEVQKILTNLLYILMLRVLGKNISVSSSQKTFLQFICVYLFYKQFLEEKHLRILKVITKHYSDIFSKDFLEQHTEQINKLEPFSGFKDFTKMINMFSIADVNSSHLTMMLVRSLGNSGFYTLIGNLDNLIASLILANYPTEIVGRGFSINSNLQSKLEDKMMIYINKIGYEDEFNRFVNKSISKEKK